MPTPGVNGHALSQFFQNAGNSLLGFFDMFTGGALEKQCRQHYLYEHIE